MKYEEMSQGEPSGGGPSPSNKSPMIQTGSLAEEMNTALETADLDSNPTLLCTSSVSLGVSLLALSLGIFIGKMRTITPGL